MMPELDESIQPPTYLGVEDPRVSAKQIEPRRPEDARFQVSVLSHLEGRISQPVGV